MDEGVFIIIYSCIIEKAIFAILLEQDTFLSFAFQNKAFVYRGQEYEKIGSFNQRIKIQFPDAQVRSDLIIKPDSYVISAMSNSIQRIKFDRNSTSELAAAFLPHIRLVLPSENATPIRTLNFWRFESNPYIILVY